MRIIKRKRLPSSEKITSNINNNVGNNDPNSESDTDESESPTETLKHKKPQTESSSHVSQHQSHLINENHPYYRVDINEPLINPYFNQQQLMYHHHQQQQQSSSFIMPPPPIPPLIQHQQHPPSTSIIIQQQFYPTPNCLDYTRLVASGQLPMQASYMLNDISNNNSQNTVNLMNHQKSSRQNQNFNENHLNSKTNLINNNSNLDPYSMYHQNLDPKEIFTNLPKTSMDHLSTSSTNLATAKHSSYYCLTPASSTTSLQEINNLSNSNLVIENPSATNHKKLKTNAGVEAKVVKTRKNAKVKQPEPVAQLAEPVQPETGKRKRGRPPKNSQPVTVAAVIKNEPIINNKLIKSFLNKTTTSSNLQKSKTSDQQPLDTKTTIQIPVITQNPSCVEAEPRLSPLPNLNWANANDLWKVMRMKDSKFKHDHLYMKRHAGIEPQMRAILIDWLIEISNAYRLHRETFHLSLEYMDRFMTLSKQEIRVDRLQLIGMTALFLASKVEEIYPPKLKELASHMESYSNDNEEAISQFELFMLKTLDWEISPITSNTWLMTYLQIASINYHSYLSGEMQPVDLTKEHNTHIVMPLHVYKNSSSNPKEQVSLKQQQFYLNNYMKGVTLLDLCLFDMESLKYNYSMLAASAMYHMLAKNVSTNFNTNQLVANLVQLCTGYKLNELDSCIKWMHPYADVCKEILTEEKMINIKQFTSIDQEDCHNIQLYYQNLDLLKEAQLRKTPSKFYSNTNSSMMTPPESSRKNQTSGVA